MIKLEEGNWQDFSSKLPSLSVSRETQKRLESYFEILARWQQKINLISSDSLKFFWQRHAIDCAQLVPLISRETKTLVDLGSGAGLPGLIIAILRPDIEVHLIESDQKKSAFLLEASRVCNAAVRLHTARIESLSHFPVDVITARALASLSKLIPYTVGFLKRDTTCLFLKGKNYSTELDEARQNWEFDVTQYPSVSDQEGCILSITNIRARS